MPKVILGNVVERIKDKVDKDNTYLEYYIGGEHFDYGEVNVIKKALIAGSTIGPAFHMRFQPGDVLLMSRNPHLRKAGRVDFEGLCSDVSYVCRTKDDSVLMQSYLPFVFQTDSFWEFAEANKKGSTNFFLNWSDFEKYEFELPSINKQKELTDLLWSAVDTKCAYRELLIQTGEMVKAQYINMFGDPQSNPKGWPVKSFDEIAIIDANMTSEYEKYANYPHIGIDSIEKETGRLFGYRTVKEDNVISPKHLFGPQHIIYSKIRPILNKVALPDFEGLCSADAYPILPKADVCNRDFLAHVLRSDFFLSYILAFSERSQMPKVNKTQIGRFKMPLPPLVEQERFAEIMKQGEKTKSEIQQSIDSIDALIKSLMQQDFTNE